MEHVPLVIEADTNHIAISSNYNGKMDEYKKLVADPEQVYTCSYSFRADIIWWRGLLEIHFTDSSKTCQSQVRMEDVFGEIAQISLVFEIYRIYVLNRFWSNSWGTIISDVKIFCICPSLGAASGTCNSNEKVPGAVMILPPNRSFRHVREDMTEHVHRRHGVIASLGDDYPLDQFAYKAPFRHGLDLGDCFH